MKKPFKKPEPGDEVEVIINNKEEKGILLESFDPGILLLKLGSGYNLGLKREDISEIKVIKRKEKDERREKEKKEELKFRAMSKSGKEIGK